jgi:hypothetical protein
MEPAIREEAKDNISHSRHSSIPIRSAYLSSSATNPHSNLPNKPSATFSHRLQLPIATPIPHICYSWSPLADYTTNWRLRLDPPWTREPTEEPLSPEMREEVRVDLIKSWNFTKMEHYRRDVKVSWMYDGGYSSLNSSSSQLQPWELTRFCNKATSFYWMSSAQENDERPLPLLPFGCIFKEWFRYHNEMPNIEFRHFFANLIRVLSIGPNTIPGIVEAHKSLCDQALSFLDRIRRGEGEQLYPSSGGPWGKPQHYKVIPLYCAIIIVMDRYVDPDVIEENGRWFIELDKHSRRQTVIMVRTGDESNLSGPISFDDLRANGTCLPLARTDIPEPDIDVDAVRVSLATAVKFVADLEQREEVAFPCLRVGSETDDCSGGAEEYAEETLKAAEEKGIDNVHATWRTVRSIKATRRGDVSIEWLRPDEWVKDPFNRSWR